MMERAFLDLMPYEVTLGEVTSRDAYGAPTVTDGDPLRAQVVVGRRLVVNRMGQELVARGVAYVAGPDLPSEDGTITVPAAFGFPTAMPIVAVTVRSDETGTVHHTEVAF